MFHFRLSVEMKQSGLCDDDGAALRAVQAFCPQGKTLAQAEFTSAEHVKSRLEGSRRGPPPRRWPSGIRGPQPSPAQRVGWGAEEQGSD